MKKRLALSLGIAMMTSLSFASASDGTQYYPTYRDGVTNVYTYSPFKQVELNTKVGYITDVQLRPNEVVQKVAAGNTTQWAVDQDMVDNIQHIYIKPLVSGTQTNLVVNTNKRVYRFLLNSTNAVEYAVAFTFPNEDKADYEAMQAEKHAQKVKAKQKELDFSQRTISVDYKVKKNSHVSREYLPKAVFDDGLKTYIELPAAARDKFPTLYSYDDSSKKLQLVNYRIHNQKMLELDAVVKRIKLVYSQNDYLLIEKEVKKAEVPSPKKIELNQQPKRLLNLLYSKQPELIQLNDTYTNKAERDRNKRLNEVKQFIKDTTPVPAPTVEAQQPAIDDTLLDKAIERLEAQVNPTPDAPPEPMMR